MKRFDYLAPLSLGEAVTMLSDQPEAVPLAGGTDILVQVKENHRSVQTFLSLNRVSEINTYRRVNGSLHIGSRVTTGKIAADPWIQEELTALAIGAGLIGSVQIRNMATIGGNICNASPSADTAPPLLALDAQAIIVSKHGERTLPIETFFLGPGQSALQPGELLEAVIVPGLPANSGSFYLRHTPRAWMDIAVVGVAAVITLDDAGAVAAVRLALGAVAPVPMRARTAEALLIGEIPDDDLIREVGATAARESRPIDDLRASADYRRHLVDVLTQRALRKALVQASKGAA